MYSVKEVYYTLQGEGAQTGRPAVFCRFSGCNLWTGREEDRADAHCTFCDTDFVGTDGPGGGKFDTAGDLAAHVKSFWPGEFDGHPYVVCTGGEPLLQLDETLIEAFHGAGLEVAIETNGTQSAPVGVDWICVSPKPGPEMVLVNGHELKLVYPQEDLQPEQFANMDFHHFFLQPMDGPNQDAHIQAAAEYCLKNPQWRLSLQTHKLIGLP